MRKFKSSTFGKESCGPMPKKKVFSWSFPCHGFIVEVQEKRSFANESSSGVYLGIKIFFIASEFFF
jgi:hypothetical protein